MRTGINGIKPFSIRCVAHFGENESRFIITHNQNSESGFERIYFT